MFNPNKNKLKQKPAVWGTFIEERRPQWKVYTERSHAINSLKCKDEYIDEEDPRLPNINQQWNYRQLPESSTLWQLIGEEWVEVPIKRFYKKGDDIIS